MKNLLITIDTMGVGPGLYINKRERYSSVFTSTISFLFYLAALLCIGYFGSELIIKAKTTVIVSREVFKEFPSLNFSNKEFMFIFSLEHKNYSYYIDNTIYEVFVVENLIKLNGTERIEKLEVDMCSKFYTEEAILEKNIDFPLDKFLFLPPNAATIIGFWGSKDYSSVKFNIMRCTNRTDNNNTCRPKEEIDELIQGGM